MQQALDIIIIENEPVWQSWASNLRSLGHSVTGFYTAEEAIAYLQSGHRPDLALVDISLGTGMDGIAFGQYIGREYVLPFMYVTTRHTDADHELISQQPIPAEHYLVKPIKMAELKAALTNFLTRRGLSKLQVFRPSPVGSPEFTVSKGRHVHRIKIDDVLYAKSETGIAVIHTIHGQQFEKHRTLKKLLEKEFQPCADHFAKPNGKYLINLKRVSSLSGTRVFMEDGTEISLSREPELLALFWQKWQGHSANPD